MILSDTPAAPAVTDALLAHIRPEVRREHPYVVGGTAQPEIKLNQNECPYDLPPDLKRDLLASFLDVPFNRYPAEAPHRLHRALADALGCSPDSLMIGNGSNELMYLLGQVLVGPQTPVVVPRPIFSLYEKVARLCGGDLTTVPPLPDLRLDTDAIVAAVRRVRPALTVLISPNNPTGLAMDPAEIERVVGAAEGFVVVDEAYIDFHPGASVLHLLDRYPNLIVLRTFSKAFGLAGLRLGFLVARPEVMREFGKARVPFMIDALTEATALALLARPDWIAERAAALRAAAADLAGALAALDGVEVVPSQANFVIFRTPRPAADVLAGLAAHGVLVRDMSGYPELQGFLRVNAGTPAENQAFLVALKQNLQA